MYAEIPESARRFLRRYISSIQQLEVFLLLARNPEQFWSTDAINAELRASELSARRALRQLVTDYLVEFRGVGPQALFRYCPGDPTVDNVVPLLAQMYRYRLPALVDFIHGPAPAPAPVTVTQPPAHRPS